MRLNCIIIWIMLLVEQYNFLQNFNEFDIIKSKLLDNIKSVTFYTKRRRYQSRQIDQSQGIDTLNLAISISVNVIVLQQYNDGVNFTYSSCLLIVMQTAL